MTHGNEFLVLTAVVDANVRFARLVDDLEREVLDIGLHFTIVEFATDESLSVEHTAKKNGSEDKKRNAIAYVLWGFNAT